MFMGQCILYRVAIYVALPGDKPPDLECDLVNISVGERGFTEIWLRCSEINSLINSIEKIIEKGLILFIAGLDGRITRSIPSNINKLIDLATSKYVIENNTEIEIEYTDPEKLATILKQAQYAKIDLKNKKATIKIRENLDTTTLFDNKIRLLKPHKIPP